MPKISVVIPCYFNEGNIPLTTAALIENESRFLEDVEYVMVDDGSEDATVEQLLAFRSKYHKQLKVVELEKNVGSYNAFFAGLERATGDSVVVMSADLQDPPELILELYRKWKEGAKVVMAVRERRNDPPSTKLFAAIFHRVLYFLPSRQSRPTELYQIRKARGVQ